MSRHITNPSTFHLRRRTPGSFLLVPFPAGSRSIRCQGQLEAAAATILVGCPLVVSIDEQPLQVWYAWRQTTAGVQIQLLDERPRRRRIGDCRASYIVPDFLVGMRDGTRRLVEVKPAHRLARSDVQRKLTVADAFAAAQGMSFHVVTAERLLPGPLLANLRMVGRYRRAACDPDVRGRLVDAIQAGPRSLRECAALAGPGEPGAGRVAVLHLLATGRLDCDPLAAPISDSTLIHAGGTHPWDPFDSVWAPSGCWMDGPSGSFARPPPISSSPGI